ncbi:MAG: GNAT family N-acetyltransferase, partial [Clostridia bacterium]|nr:GNAT family N-acetyltransferase [Clostridia bacterium]
MKIFETTDKRKYKPLLLLADEQESMVDRYIDEAIMYVLDDGGVKGEIAVCDVGNGVLEIKNLAVYPQYQRRGYGRILIEFICEKYRGFYRV